MGIGAAWVDTEAGAMCPSPQGLPMRGPLPYGQSVPEGGTGGPVKEEGGELSLHSSPIPGPGGVRRVPVEGLREGHLHLCHR